MGALELGKHWGLNYPWKGFRRENLERCSEASPLVRLRTAGEASAAAQCVREWNLSTQ
jgi:hypothetical protein